MRVELKLHRFSGMANSYFGSDTPEVVLRSLFTKYDQDNSGHIGKEELLTLLTDDLGLSDSEADVYTHLMDKDGSSSVCYDEFKHWFCDGDKLNALNDQSRYHLLSKAVEMFRQYDCDGNQAIGIDEFYQLMSNIGGNEHSIDEAFKSLDSDQNGKISFPEFLRWLNWIQFD